VVGPAGGNRVVVTGKTIVGAHAGEVYAMDPAGTPLWHTPLPTGVVTLRPWGDAVLVTDAATAWLLRLADGTEVFNAKLADLELVKSTAEGQDSPPEIGAIAVGSDWAFVGLGTAVVAIDRTGAQNWRASRGDGPPIGSPLAAHGTWLLTQDPMPAAASTGTPAATKYRLGLRVAGTGMRRWIVDYTPTPFTPPAGGPPGGPQGAPPGGGPGGPPPGGPPGNDEAWQRHEAVFGTTQVVVRDAAEVRAFNLADRGQLWVSTSPMPVAGLEVVGGLVLVAADKILTYSLPNGNPRWQAAFRGARMIGTPDGTAVVVASESTVVAIDTNGSKLWETALPPSVADIAAVDRVMLGNGEVYVILKPRDGGQPLDVDVVALSLT
jgi:outer membrane protein assembly factor BamB